MVFGQFNHGKRVYARLGSLLLVCAVLSCVVQRPARSIAARADLQNSLNSRFGVVEAWRAPQQAAAIGVGWERLTLWWKALQPDGPNSWNAFATGHDGYINRELAAGRKLAGELINTPDWAAANLSQHGSSIPKGLYLPYDDPQNYWGHFVSLIAKRYAGRIDDWVLWNEVNIPSGKYSTWKGSVADYAQLVKVAYLAAHRVNPHARIVLFGDPYWYDHGAFFTKLLDKLALQPGAAANNGYFDVANVHLYNRPLDYATIIPLYMRLLAQHHLHKPIWISETNAIPFNDPVRLYPRAGFFATLNDQASYIVEAFAIAVSLGVERVEVNRMIDGTDFTAGGEPFGLLRNDMSARPAYSAYRTAVQLLSGVTSGRLSVNAVSGVYTVTLHKPGATITVAWDQTPLPASVTIPAVSSSATKYTKLGVTHSVHASSGSYRFPLEPATGNTDPSNPKDYVMGGSPLILVQAS
ncbi:MAG: exported protein of unknown function [Chloroflexi bacterium]|nr:exported protein of unknown function [Chloroflexota bacterium]